MRGHGRDGAPEPGWAGRLEDRNVAFTRLLVSSGLRRAEGGSLLTFEVPGLRLDGGRYYRGKVAAGVTRLKKYRTFYAAADAIGAIEATPTPRARGRWLQAQRKGLYERLPGGAWSPRSPAGRSPGALARPGRDRLASASWAS